MKTAICQVADTGPLESLVMMLRSAGYAPHLPDDRLRSHLRTIGCDTVLDPASLVKNMGYDQPMDLPLAGIDDMRTAELYVDIKAHRNGPKVWDEWPNLRSHTLWYRINGGEPEITERGGDEINLVCPILTPNLWYNEPGPWEGKAYACWPPFYRWKDYLATHKRTSVYSPPVCLIHNINGWGHGDLVPGVRNLGVNCYGSHSSPDGLVQHSEIPKMLSSALCMVHLKSNDCPGYSLYEALAAACPLVVSRKLIWRMKMESLFVEGETCLCFDQPGHQGRTPADTETCTGEIADAIKRLSIPAENARIGLNGHRRLAELMWQENRGGNSLRGFFARNFP